MTLVEQKFTRNGNIIATYEPDGEVETGTFASEEPSPAELQRRELMRKGAW
jgi:hypothetical protein